ncbi:MAG: radical SAM protein, partial [Roseburia sp.]|nr:radical SAM protein [Roseburia sp.]
YTGDIWENVVQDNLVNYIDVLVDGEFMIEEKDATLHWKGSANQRVIDVQKTLQQADRTVPVLYGGR